MGTLSPRSRLGPSWRGCPDKPTFHVIPPQGWINDPNGITWHGDDLHIFFQHIVDSNFWAWRMEWGHVVSRDGGATFRHAPVVMRPTPGGHDGCGCWSGCCVPAADDGSHPATILYTGVKRVLGDGRPVAPHGDDAPVTVHEVVCAATCTDGDLDAWTKQPALVIAARPAGAAAWAGFRDPFVYQRRTADTPWRLILGTGIDGRGAAVVYECAAAAPATPGAWRFCGQLTTGAPRPLPTAKPGDATRGISTMWECPLFVQIPVCDDDGGDARQAQAPTSTPCPSTWPWLLIVSPVTSPSPPRAVPIAWIAARLTPDGRVPLDAATTAGPVATDLAADGLLYATTAAVPPAGSADRRPLLLSWLQEDAERDGYAGCLSLGKRVWCVRRHDPAAAPFELRQCPDPAVATLRIQPGVATPVLTTGGGGAPVPVPGARGAALDVVMTLARAAAPSRVLLRARHAGPDTGGVPAVVALVADWAAKEMRIEWARCTENDDDDDLAWTQNDPRRVVKSHGGPCPDVAGDRLRLRLLIDHSVIEVFTGSGRVLTARVYRGAAARAARLCLAGAGAVATDVHAWQMRPCWEVVAV